MSGDFEWRTCEDDAWPEPSLKEERARHRSLRPLLLFFTLGLALGLTGLLAYRLVGQRAADARAAVEADVLSAHQLIRQADRHDDRELFRFALSDGDQDWFKAQEQLLVGRSLLDRPAFGLKAITPDSAGLKPKNIDVRLSPDLTSAEVQFDQAYASDDNSLVGTTIRLRQAAVYRLGERWLLASPQEEYWGQEETLTREHLLVTFPERDREIVRPLVSDLDRLVRDACHVLVGLDCPERMRILLDFDGRPETLTMMDRFVPIVQDTLELKLPTPSLVGWPLDEASYQALQRGYGSVVLTALIAMQVEYQCCRHGPFYRAMLDAQLDQLGLRSWPLAKRFQGQPDQLFVTSLRGLHDVGLFWFSNRFSGPVEDIWPVYILVDFLGREMNLPLIDLQRNLAHRPDLDYRSWLRDIAADLQISVQELERAWLLFSQEALAFRQPKAPAPPQQDLQLACRPNEEARASLYRYDIGDGELAIEQQLGYGEALVIGLPDDHGVIVAERRPINAESGTRVSLWADGQQFVLAQSEDNLVPVPFHQLSDDSQANLVILNRRQRQYGLLPVRDCPTTRNCSITTLHGFPLWSPDGSSLLSLVSMGSYGYEARFERPLTLGGATGEIIGAGKEPFWLDDQTVAFINPQGKMIIAVDVDDLNRWTLLSVMELANALPSSHASETGHLQIEFAAIMPNKPDSLLIIAKGPKHTYFFVASRQGEGVVLEHFTETLLTPEFLTDLTFSPDGRWLVISTNDLTYHVATITFYDTIARETLHYRFHGQYDLPMHWQMDWSAGGQWLSIIDNGYMRLIAPAFDYQRLIVPGEVTCTAAVWIN